GLVCYGAQPGSGVLDREGDTQPRREVYDDALALRAGDLPLLPGHNVPDAVGGVDDLVTYAGAELARLGARGAGRQCAPVRGRTETARCGPGHRAASLFGTASSARRCSRATRGRCRAGHG